MKSLVIYGYVPSYSILLFDSVIAVVLLGDSRKHRLGTLIARGILGLHLNTTSVVGAAVSAGRDVVVLLRDDLLDDGAVIALNK